jgi:alpha-beta hydrolase superfamily lysophospholipase
VGAGYAVILPDFAGYAAYGSENNPPPSYHASEDLAKSVLDSARALRSLEPSLFSPQVVLMGHSMGGHAALSALAMHASYGSGGELAAVVTYAPSWFPMTSFAGMIALASSFPLPEEANSVAASVWYHYSHAELLDGPGTGPLLFAADKRDAMRAFFEQSCDPAALADLGANIGELFDPGFATEVAYFAGAGLPCITERCTTWTERYAADRPHLTGAAKTVPILLVHGDEDDWIPPERATCGFDRLEADGANVTFCIVPGAKHDPVVGMQAEYVNRWIAKHTLGEPDPGTCGLPRDALHDEDGQTASCAALPPND